MLRLRASTPRCRTDITLHWLSPGSCGMFGFSVLGEPYCHRMSPWTQRRNLPRWLMFTWPRAHTERSWFEKSTHRCREQPHDVGVRSEKKSHEKPDCCNQRDWLPPRPPPPPPWPPPPDQLWCLTVSTLDVRNLNKTIVKGLFSYRFPRSLVTSRRLVTSRWLVTSGWLVTRR